jgi:hypothetical protein
MITRANAPLGDVITLDFINADLDPGARAGIELTLEKAKELRAALDRAIGGAEFRSRKCGARASCPTMNCTKSAEEPVFDAG